MIITLTLNPAVDQTIFVRRLEPGEVNRFAEAQLDPAGKGINVARMAQRLGWPTIAFGFLAGEIGLLAERALDAEGVAYHFVRVPGQTRLNVTVVDQATGTATSFYGPGPAVEPEHVAGSTSCCASGCRPGGCWCSRVTYPPGSRRAPTPATSTRRAGRASRPSSMPTTPHSALDWKQNPPSSNRIGRRRSGC